MKYSDVPKDFHENIQFRLKLRDWAKADASRQAYLKKCCEDDPLFFLNAFCFLYEPRPEKGTDGVELPMVRPFITWPHQDPVILQISESLGFKDIGVEKSRGEGASWIAATEFLRLWLFKPNVALGMVSRNELAVDSPDDPDSLMWKCDWQLTLLPKWMVPKTERNQTRHILKNLENGATIIGYAATGDVASGGRKYAFLMDELSKFPRGQDEAAMDSTSPVTKSRLVVSTPKGPEGAYARAMKEDAELVRLVLDWKDNISRNRNLYRVMEGRPVAVDAEKYGPLPEDYRDKEKWVFLKKRLELRGFQLEGTTRSPWYDEQCMRVRATPKSIAQEYDRDYGGSMSRFFDCGNIDRLLQGPEATACSPKFVGDLSFDTEDFLVNFTPNPTGRLRVWCNLDLKLRPPNDVTYIVSADVAMGSGGDQASNSVIVATIKETGVKVAEFASPVITPESLANYAVAFCKWCQGKDGDGFLIWETNGPGGPFRERVMDVGFRNVYRRVVREETSRKKTTKVGWASTTKTKHELLSAYNFALQTGTFVNPSAEALAECKQFQLGARGKISHIAAESSTDPTGAGENHGDRVIADALGHWARQEGGEVGVKDKKPAAKAAPTNSFAGRREAWLSSRKKEDAW